MVAVEKFSFRFQSDSKGPLSAMNMKCCAKTDIHHSYVLGVKQFERWQKKQGDGVKPEGHNHKLDACQVLPQN